MAGFASLEELRQAIRASAVLTASFWKSKSQNDAPDRFSMWGKDYQPPAEAAASASPGAALSQSGITFPAVSPRHKYLQGVHVNIDYDSMVTFYDRLVEVSSLTLNSTGNKTVSSAALTRYTDGEGVEAWIEITQALSGSPAAATLSMNSYTDSDGNTGHAGASITTPTSFPLAGLLQLPLQAGDRGVRAVSTINVSTATGTNGSCNLVLLRRLVTLPVRGVIGLGSNPQTGPRAQPNRNRATYAYDWKTDRPGPMIRIYDGASIGIFYERINATTNRNISGSISVVLG